MPITAAPVVLILHIVLSLHRGFTDAGIIAAAAATGTGLGSPIVGRALDAVPLRHILAVTTAASCAFWVLAVRLGFIGLLVAAFVAGLLTIPVFTISRQSLGATLPTACQMAGLSLDAMSVEISFAIGPALGVVVITQAGSEFTFAAIAVATAAAGIAPAVLNPRTRAQDSYGGDAAHHEANKRRWIGKRLVAVLIATLGATLTLAGTDTAITAAMRSFGQIDLLGVVVLCWCLSSLAGGFLYGRRSNTAAPPWLLLASMSLLRCLSVSQGTGGCWP